MIALLPLRGWAGEAMATQMAINSAHNAPHNIAILSIANYSTNTPATAINSLKTLTFSTFATHSASETPDCDMHASMAYAKTAIDAEEAKDLKADASHSCNHCQACHAVGLTAMQLHQASLSAVTALPQVQIKRLASADLALRQKPPIL